VYQAYSPHIAHAAIAAGTFVTPFKQGRMTWIKPSFLWMMYRSGWYAGRPQWDTQTAGPRNPSAATIRDCRLALGLMVEW
jgi:hypothetical protein